MSRTQVRNRSRGRAFGVAAALVAATSLLLAACGSSNGSSSDESSQLTSSESSDSASSEQSTAQAEEVTLTYAGFGGSFGDAETAAYITEFESQNPGVKIVYDPTVSWAKLKAMVEAGQPTWDIYTANLQDVDASKWFEPLDCSIIPCDEIIKTPQTSEYIQMYYSYANVLTYNKELTGDNPPTSWADFFDLEKYPGGRAIYGSVTDLYGVVTAALGRGVAVDKVFPLDMDANLAKLDEIRDQIIWYESNEQCPQMVDSGEAIMGVCLNGRNTNAVADGATNIAWDWHQSEMSFGEVAIPKGIPESHLQPAQKFVAFMLSKEQNGRLSDYIAYGPTNTEATYVNSELEQDLPSSHYDDEHVEFDWAWQNSEEGVAALEKYAAWRQGG